MITLAGMIGAGKTTYTELLARELNAPAFYEAVDHNPLLEAYYDDPSRYAFPLQIYFLNKRFRAIKDAGQHPDSVLDRSIYEDALFTAINHESGNMTSAEYDLYLELLDNMMEEINALPKKAPELLIYLRGSLDTHLDRIKKRGRPFEQTDGKDSLYDYYAEVHSRYDEWFAAYDKSPTLVFNVDRLDLNCEEDREYVLRTVRQKLEELRHDDE